VADILNQSGRATEEKILKRLENQSQGLSDQIQNQMFIFDDIFTLTDRELDTVLRDVAIPDLAVAIAGGSAEVVERIQVNLSDERRGDLENEAQKLDEVLASEIEEAQLRIVQVVRKLEEDSKLKTSYATAPENWKKPTKNSRKSRGNKSMKWKRNCKLPTTYTKNA